MTCMEGTIKDSLAICRLRVNLLNVISTQIEGVILLEPRVFGDHRGFFLESDQKQRYADAGIDVEFVQDNISFMNPRYEPQV